MKKGKKNPVERLTILARKGKFKKLERLLDKTPEFNLNDPIIYGGGCLLIAYVALLCPDKMKEYLSIRPNVVKNINTNMKGVYGCMYLEKHIFEDVVERSIEGFNALVNYARETRQRIEFDQLSVSCWYGSEAPLIEVLLFMGQLDAVDKILDYQISSNNTIILDGQIRGMCYTTFKELQKKMKNEKTSLDDICKFCVVRGLHSEKVAAIRSFIKKRQLDLKYGSDLDIETDESDQETRVELDWTKAFGVRNQIVTLKLLILRKYIYRTAPNAYPIPTTIPDYYPKPLYQWPDHDDVIKNTKTFRKRVIK